MKKGIKINSFLKFFLISIFFIIFGLYFLQISQQGINIKKQSGVVFINEKIYIDGSLVTNWEQEITKGSTALELLKKTATIRYSGEGKNAFVTKINGRTAQTQQKEYWALYINSKLSDIGAGSYILHPNDKIEWKIEKY